MSKLVCPATLSVATVSTRVKGGFEVVAFCEKRRGHKGKHKAGRPTDRHQFVTIEWDVDSGHFCEFCGDVWSPEHRCGK